MAALAIHRHVALVGFMGAGKSSLGAEAAASLGRPFLDVDLELERELRDDDRGHLGRARRARFRELEEDLTVEALAEPVPADARARGRRCPLRARAESLRDRALTLLVDVEVEEAWRRVRNGGDRPLARDEELFRRLYEARADLPGGRGRADAGRRRDRARGGRDPCRDGCAGPPRRARPRWRPDRARLRPPRRRDPRRRCPARPRRPPRHDARTFAGRGREALDEVARLWDELQLERSGTLVALGGGCTTDAAGFAAASYLRGIPWVPVPTTLVGQVDAAIGGKATVNLAGGKNLVGAFHWPVRTLIDPALLATLPEGQRLEGMAEVVKTGLLAGERLWELPEPELVRRCAAYKAAVCLRDPHDPGPAERAQPRAHVRARVEAAGGYGAVSHGRAVALGLLAALRLSGVDEEPVRRMLDPRPVHVDRERAWAALQRDKKARDGAVRLVLLDARDIRAGV